MLEKRPTYISYDDNLSKEQQPTSSGAAEKTISTPIVPENLISKTTPKPTESPISEKRGTSYMPLFGGIYTSVATTYQDVESSDFYLNVADFDSASFYLEATVMVEAGSGEVTARIFDLTNGVSVPGSEVSSSSKVPENVRSSRLIFLKGDNRYKIQIKSKLNNPVYFYSGKIKIVY